MKLLKLQTKANCFPDMNIQGIAVTLMQDFEKAIGAPFGLDVIAFFKRGTMSWYGYDRQVEQLRRDTTECLKKEPAMAKHFRKKLFENAQTFFKFIEQLDKTDLASLDNPQFWNLCQGYFDQYRAVCMWGEPLAHYTKEKLAEFLLDYLKTKSKTPEDDLNLLCTPNYVSFTQCEEIDMLKMAIEIRKHPESKQKLLHEHTKKYFWIPYDYGVCIWDKGHFEKELENAKNPDEQLKKKKYTIMELPKKQQQRIKELNIDQYYQELFEAQQTCAILMDYKKEVLTQGHYASRRLIEDIARRLSITLTQAKVLLMKEIKEYLSTNTKPDTCVLDERYECGLVRILKNGEYSFISGKEAREMLKKLEETDTVHGDEVRGFPACKGKCTGVVRVITDAKNIGEMKQGEILVAHMTSPDFTLGIKKAAAIVTDEGGMTCHAAIVSRELNIPCIIGAKNATKVLKTGDVVEVDAEKGIIQKIQNVRFSSEHIKQSWEPNDASIQMRTQRGEGTSAPNPAEIAVYRKYVAEYVKSKQQPRALVLGATPELRDAAIKHGCETVAVDVSPTVLKNLTNVMQFRDSPLNKSIHGDWLEMDSFLWPASFDIVLADASLNNVPPEGNRKVLGIVKKLLKKGGIFVTRNLVVPEQRITRTPDDIIAEYNTGKNTCLGFFLEMGYKTAFFEEAYNPATKEYTWGKVCSKYLQLANRLKPEQKEAVEQLTLQASTVTNIIFPKRGFENMLKEFFSIREIICVPQYPYTAYAPIYVLQN